MSQESHFNRAGRRSGGDKLERIVLGPSSDLRAVYLAILKDQVVRAGVQGADLQEVYDRLDATETSVLRDCVREGAVSQAEKLALEKAEAEGRS